MEPPREPRTRVAVEPRAPDGEVRIRIVGDLDHEGADEVEEAFVAAVDDARADVLVDLSECPFVASQGIRLLLDGRRRLVRHDRGMGLTGLHPQVRDVFEMTGVLVAIPERPEP